MSHLKRLFNSYAEERLSDVSPEEIERFWDVFMAGVAVTHALYGDPTRTFARQRRRMVEIHTEIREYGLEAALRERKRRAAG